MTRSRRLFLTFAPPEPVQALLEARRQVRFASQAARTAGAALSELADEEAAIVAVTDALPAEVVAGLPPTLRMIGTYSVGYDHIDLAACAAREIDVLHTPDVLSTSVAENALFLMLGVARRATESIDLVRGGKWGGWAPTQLLGFELEGKRLGILGMGRIGRQVARRATALGMTVSYHNTRPVAGPEGAGFIYEAELETFLGGLDVLVLAAPSTAQTRGIVNARTIALMQPSAVVINIARGDLVDDEALIEALSSGRLAGAGLDVFNHEPRYDARYAALPNVFMLPHIGSSTIEARLAMARILLDGMDAIERGERPRNQLVR